MSRQVISFDKGTKRGIQQIRWKQREIVGIISLFLITVAFGVWLALREVSNYYHPPRTPEVKPLH